MILLAAAGYAAATYFMKHAAHAGELVSVGLAMLVFQLVVAVEILLLRRMDLSNAYVMILGVETLMIVALAYWLGGRRPALYAAVFFAIVALSGWWDRSVITLYAVFAAVAILETVGPPMVARALFWSGDADDHKPTNEPENVTDDAQQAPTVNP